MAAMKAGGAAAAVCGTAYDAEAVPTPYFADGRSTTERSSHFNINQDHGQKLCLASEGATCNRLLVPDYCLTFIDTISGRKDD